MEGGTMMRMQLCITGEAGLGGGGAVAKVREGKRRGRLDNDGTAT